MVKKVFFLLIIFSFATSQAAFASTTSASFLGADTDPSKLSLIEQELHIPADAPSFSVTDAANELHTTISSAQSLDSLTEQSQNNKLTVTLISNTSAGANTIDTLGFTDMLLMSGVYNAKVSAIVHDPQISLAEALKGYSTINSTVDPSRISDTQKAMALYMQTEGEVQNIPKVSEMFFNLTTGLMEDPDTHLPTNTIAVTAIQRENFTLSSKLTTAIENWAYTYVADGNKWQGFYRYASSSDTTAPVITVQYRPLLAASQHTVNPADTQNRKLIAVCVILILIIIIAYAVRRKRTSAQDGKASSTAPILP